MGDFPPGWKEAMALAEHQAKQLLTYPPKDVLSVSEERALTGMKVGKTGRAALQKLVADACASAFFHFFCLIDAVGDPQVQSGRRWTGAWITAPKDDRYMPMLHDLFYELYWEHEKVMARASPRSSSRSSSTRPRRKAGRGALPNPTLQLSAKLPPSGRSRGRS